MYVFTGFDYTTKLNTLLTLLDHALLDTFNCLSPERTVKPVSAKSKIFLNYTIFFIRTSNFGAEAGPSYFSLQFEPENVLSMFLKLCGIVFRT